MIDLADLYGRYGPDVFRFSLYLSGNRADAEDITAETFVRALVASDRIVESTVKAYLFSIARNLFLLDFRYGQRRSPLKADLRDWRVSICDQIAQREELAAVLDNVRQLPYVDRAAFLMRTLDELPYEEIAKSLGISTVSARVKVHRARAGLFHLRRNDTQ